METKKMSFEDLPQAMSYLIQKVEDLEKKIESKPEVIASQNSWMNLEELIAYLPDHPAKQTVYGWVSHKLIPCRKGGKKLRFLKSEIDEWMEKGKRKSYFELVQDASQYLKNNTAGIKDK